MVVKAQASERQEWLLAPGPLASGFTALPCCCDVQGAVQHAFYGKPKATNQDEWDRLIAARDQRILEEWRQKQG